MVLNELNKKEFQSGINVLSLCDGMSCGHIALDVAGIKVNKYYASEIKEIGIKVTNYNYPDTIQIGDVNNISYKNGVLYTDIGEFVETFDLVIFGSPCQSFSIAIREDLRVGLNNKEKSGLFLECYRILKEVNPTWFLMENVASMKEADKNFITNLLGVDPIRLNSKLVSPALRDRYYWTNIKNIKPIHDKKIRLSDILTSGWTNREKARCISVMGAKAKGTPTKMFYRYLNTGFTNIIFKNREQYYDCLDYYEKNYKGKTSSDIPVDDKVANKIFDGIRVLNTNELKHCQTVPKWYDMSILKDKDAADVLGDGWTIDIIVHILKNINKQ